jgi:hypothetical protein
MDFPWIVVGLAGWALALVFVLLLMRMASEHARTARRNEKKLDPFSALGCDRTETPKDPP